MKNLTSKIVMNNNMLCVSVFCEVDNREFLNPIPVEDLGKTEQEQIQRWIDKYNQLFPEE